MGSAWDHAALDAPSLCSRLPIRTGTLRSVVGAMRTGHVMPGAPSHPRWPGRSLVQRDEVGHPFKPTPMATGFRRDRGASCLGDRPRATSLHQTAMPRAHGLSRSRNLARIHGALLPGELSPTGLQSRIASWDRRVVVAESAAWGRNRCRNTCGNARPLRGGAGLPSVARLRCRATAPNFSSRPWSGGRVRRAGITLVRCRRPWPCSGSAGSRAPSSSASGKLVGSFHVPAAVGV